MAQDLARSQVIRIDDYMGMFAGVGEPAELFGMIAFNPIQFAAGGADLKRGVEVNEQVGFGDNLPHGWHVGMFLCDVTTNVAVLIQPRDKRGFPGAAGTHYADQQTLTGRFIHVFTRYHAPGGRVVQDHRARQVCRLPGSSVNRWDAFLIGGRAAQGRC